MVSSEEDSQTRSTRNAVQLTKFMCSAGIGTHEDEGEGWLFLIWTNPYGPAGQGFSLDLTVRARDTIPRGDGLRFRKSLKSYISGSCVARATTSQGSQFQRFETFQQA